MNNILKDFDAILYKKNSKYPDVFTDAENEIFRTLTGLDFSAGAVVIARKKSALFVDGRYSLAAKLSVDPNKFEILDLKNTKITQWIEENLPTNSVIACDFQYFTHEEMAFFINRLEGYRFSSVNLQKVSEISEATSDAELYYLGDVDDTKFNHIRKEISKNDLDAYLICDPCSVAWIYNMRDLNRKHTPIPLANLLVFKDGQKLYFDNQYDDLQQELANLSRVGIDVSQTPFSLQHRDFVPIKNPCLLPKSIKTKKEIAEIKLAARKDSIAITNFINWFCNTTEKITELDAAEKLLSFRKEQEGFIGESFKTIAAADENAAIIHYSPTEKTNKVIENILLLDSGGQYKHGTTDVTRTICKHSPTEEQKLCYTLVLKGHIALADAKFPVGTTGSQLDSLARQFLWKYSKDYNHSTGHGIGYLSHVHEGPAAISRINDIPLQAGMIFSNEPGYYQENGFGIRLENMMVVTEAENGFLSFETISHVPFDEKFMDKSLLTSREIAWLEEYSSPLC